MFSTIYNQFNCCFKSNTKEVVEFYIQQHLNTLACIYLAKIPDQTNDHR